MLKGVDKWQVVYNTRERESESERERTTARRRDRRVEEEIVGGCLSCVRYPLSSIH
jgi:hypothetical protein